MLKFTVKGAEGFFKRATTIRELKVKIPAELKRVCDSFGNKVIRLSKEKYILNGGYDAPVDSQRITSRTGNLRRNIVAETEVNDLRAIVNIGVRRNVKYARIHEFGGNAGRNGTSFIKARPYLTPAIKDSLPALKADLSSILSRILK